MLRRDAFFLVMLMALTFLLTWPRLSGAAEPGQPYSPGLEAIRERLVKEALAAELQRNSLVLNREGDGAYTASLEAGLTLVYTLDPCLQEAISRFLKSVSAPYAAFVAVEPKTGRVLAMVDYPQKGFSLKATYPAASLFKLVTAAAALEKGRLSPSTKIKYRGQPHGLTQADLKEDPRRDRKVTTFKEALGTSNNVVFARIALKMLGAETLKRYAEAFRFNRTIEFDLPLQPSQAQISNEPYALARAGAGYQDVTISPLHAALLAAAIANDGIMVRPRLVDKVLADGETVYQTKPKSLGRVISANTAKELREMMEETVTHGTSSRAFRLFSKAYASDELRIGGKTGTLNGDDPKGRYDWFVGLAPLDKPRIAVAALVINNGGKRSVKGSYVALEAFKIYFQEKGCLVAGS